VATEVYVFLPPPNASGVYREAYPFGPDSTTFHPDLGIEIDPAQQANSPALAVVDGLVYLIPNPTLPLTASMVLIPSPTAITDLGFVVGQSVVVFVYRNLDLASVRTAMTPFIEDLGDEPFLQNQPLNARVDEFMNGGFGVWVDAGDELGQASTVGGSGGFALLGFEIAYVPSALAGAAGFLRTLALIKPDNAATRRLDPMAFYALVVAGAPGISLTALHAGHPLLTEPTRRTLLSLRDEYDQPYVGTVAVGDSSAGTTTPYSFTAANWGTVELAVTPPGGTPPTSTYDLDLTNYIFSALPTGQTFGAKPSATLTAPTHWSLSTIFMADVDDPANWFVANTAPLPRFTTNNLVTPLIDGFPDFAEVVAASRTVTAPDHYWLLLGWRMIDSFQLVPGDPTTTVRELTNSMALAGAQVRAMLWDQPGPVNNPAVWHINGLPGGNGKAILDDNVPTFGSHHQKLLVVNGSNGAVAFCGGIDINKNRRDDPRHCAKKPYHDIHAKIEGPAVADLYTTFVQRWNTHPDAPPPLPTSSPPFAASPGTHFVQVSRTYAAIHGYPFAPSGDLGTLNAVRRAIQRARRFIYLEDQYATPYPGDYPYDPSQDTVGILSDLLQVLAQPLFEYMIIVITNESGQPQSRFRRHQFIRPLRDAFPNKVYPFYLERKQACASTATTLTDTDEPEVDPSTDLVYASSGATDITGSSGGPSRPEDIYVHTKSWIIDDVYVKIGSCNCNRRGYTFDTEADIHVIDGATLNGARAFARNYRMNLWAEHLDLLGANRRYLDDPTYALQFWLHPNSGAHITPYDETANLELIHTDISWNNVVDPDGR
jgi:phosphatidylserine/phosphatidylglycerophosphate/cardiolipin synthase-like enzyme